MSQFEASYTADGISQLERYPESLRPGFFNIEERDVDDMLRFVIELSQHFNYYNLNNEIDGDWEDILIGDINVVLRVIPKFDVNYFIKRFDQLRAHIHEQHAEEANKEALGNLLDFLHNFLRFQESVHEKFRITVKTDQGIEDFRKLVSGYDRFDEEAIQLDQYLTAAYAEFGSSVRRSSLTRLRKDDEPVTEFTLEGDHSFARISFLIKHVSSLFAKLRMKYNRLSEAAEWFLYKQRSSGDHYEPHMALMVSFLELYQYLKKDINQLTQKHLDLYYRDILGIQPRKAVPDKVQLVFRLNPAYDQYLLPAGEEVIGTLPVTGEEVTFVTDQDLMVTGAQIGQLNTVYVSDNVKIPSKDDIYDDVREQQVFMSANPIVPGKESWALMGEDQLELSAEERSMMPADMGLFVSSPLFYARDGKRCIATRFYITNKSATLFMQHVRNFSGVSGTHEKVLIFEMLSKAFLVEITGDEGWIAVPKYTVNYDLEQAVDKFFEIEFELGHVDPPIAVYDSAIHGHSSATEWPLMRLLLNNSSFHNPYTFLKDMILDRIAVKLSVTDSHSLKLQNNIGELSMANPFQVFGPQPTIGAYIDLKNPNIFNTYTKDITIRFNWFDLPRDKGGFNTYYEGYPDHFSNHSFNVAVSGLNDGRFQPSVVEQRQRYSLFAMHTEAGKQAFLNATTTFDHFDLTKLRFSNQPSLDKTDVATDMNLREGAVRFELVSPAEGFGHRIYPGLFPEVIMHNAKRFAKKKPLPNQPYIPVLATVSVDYVLEHAETVNGVSRENDSQHDVMIWHHTPFGQRKIYPANDVTEATIIPALNDQSNLYIGVTDVKPGQLLSLLFQIEDNSYSTGSYEAELPGWAVLIGNKWLTIDRTSVLADSTSNFIKSGIVLLRLPELEAGGHTMYDPGYYWLRASCNHRGNLRTQVRAIYTQSVTATRVIDKAATYNGILQLQPGILNTLRKQVPQLTELQQPCISFGGKQDETTEKYYARVSERLRHKQRPVTTTDIAQMVLEEFPDILKVHCLRAGSAMQGSEGSDIQVIVIPGRNAHSSDVHGEPKASLATLYEIRKFLMDSLPPFIKVDVVNPVYERVKVVCSVVFNENRVRDSVGNNINRLNTDISRFISPWLYSIDSDVKMEARLYVSEVLNFIKKCSYVSHVTSFSLLHFYKEIDSITGVEKARVIDTAVDKADYLKGSMPGCILITAPDHEIAVLSDKKYIKPLETGIGGLVIGDELLVTQREDEQAATEEERDGTDEMFDFLFQTND